MISSTHRYYCWCLREYSVFATFLKTLSSSIILWNKKWICISQNKSFLLQELLFFLKKEHRRRILLLFTIMIQSGKCICIFSLWHFNGHFSWFLPIMPNIKAHINKISLWSLLNVLDLFWMHIRQRVGGFFLVFNFFICFSPSNKLMNSCLKVPVVETKDYLFIFLNEKTRTLFSLVLFCLWSYRSMLPSFLKFPVYHYNSITCRSSNSWNCVNEVKQDFL